MTPRRRIFIAALAFSAIVTGPFPTRAQTSAANYFKQGDQHFNNAEWDQAIASFQAALKVDPGYSDAQLLLSLCYLLDGKPDLARAGAIKYESMKPNDPGGYVAQSQAASALSLYAEAVQAAQTAIRLRPDKTNLAAAYFQLGYNEYMLGKRQEADQAYQTLKTIDTDSAQTLYTAIQRLEADKKPKPASTAAPAATSTTQSQTASTKSGVSSAADYLAQGKAKYEAKDYNQAVILYGMAVQLDPTLADGYFELSMVYFQLGKYDLVRSSAKSYESLKPGDPNGFMMEAFADRKLNRNAEAITALNAAIPLKPESTTNLPSCYYELGMNYYRLGKMQEVNQVYEKLKTINAKWAKDLYDAVHDSDTPTATSGAAKPAPDPSKQAGLDLVNSHVALEFAAIMPYEKFSYSEKIFVLQYRDYSPENKKAADELWAKIRAQEKDGATLLQIPKALVISSTKSTIDVALMSDNQQTKTADTHVTLSKALTTPPARGSTITVYGVITSYTAKPFLFTVERGQLTPPGTTAAAPAIAGGSSSKPAPSATNLPDLPDLPDARGAIQAASLIGADDLTLTDVIFILQYRDASVSNQNAAKKVWSEVLAKEKDGQPLQISNALVISSTRTTVDLALSDDCKHAKTADTHLVLAKPLATPARAGLVTNISGAITSYKTNPIMLTIEHGQLLATAAASTTPSPAATTHTSQPKPAPAATPAAAAPAPPSPADNWILYSNPNGNFAARMPSAPKDTINPTGSDQVSHTLQASADGNAYTVVYVHNQTEGTVDSATYTIFRDNFMKGMPTCQLITEGDPSPVVRGYVGHSYRLNCVFSGTKVTIIGDLYWGRHFAYAVMAVFPTATFDPPLAKTFVDSFALVDPSK